MEITNRTVRILYVKDRGLLASDSVGRIHLFDDDLNLIQSSPAVSNGQPIYAITVADKWVVGKDRMGNIMRWSLDTLDLIDYYDARTTCDSRLLMTDEEPTIKINRGITVWQNRVYVNNGYMQLVILDLDSFAVEKIIRSPSGDAPIEWICTDHPKVHAMSDKKGHLYLGNLETLEFSTVLQLDTLSLHRVLFDHKHNRFWVTQDSGNRQSINVNNGIVIVFPNGEIEQQIQFARDDVEFLVFSLDYDKAIAGGFDGQLVIIDNSQREVKIEKTITGFTHQLSDCMIGPKGQIYVLTLDGEILRIDENGRCHRAPFRRQAIWDIQASLDNPQALFCATDDGVMVVEVVLTPRGESHIQLREHHLSGFGFTRRIVPLPDGYIGITRDQEVFRTDKNGRLCWHRHLSPLLHTLSVTPTYAQVLIATDEGGFVLDAATEMQINHISTDDLPIWASSILPSGDYILGNRHGTICAFDPENNMPKWRVELEGYPI